jgi:exonuclease III
MPMLKLISINIEGDRHLTTFIPFLQKEKPDVFALQEIFKERIPDIERETGTKLVCFFPMHTDSNIIHPGLTDTTLGVALFSNLTVKNIKGLYYVGDESKVPKFIYSQNPTLEATIGSVVPNSSNLVLACGEFEKEGIFHQILTTHFTYTRDGIATPFQLEHLERLFKVLDTISGDFVLVGDFNAPRGRETWTRLAARYKDNIPDTYTSSLDPVLHKTAALKLPYVVDGCFTSEGYIAKNVSLISGVSDHMAIVALIETNNEVTIDATEQLLTQVE